MVDATTDVSPPSRLATPKKDLPATPPNANDDINPTGGNPEKERAVTQDETDRPQNTTQPLDDHIPTPTSANPEHNIDKKAIIRARV
jgi:hypothetical protein